MGSFIGTFQVTNEGTIVVENDGQTASIAESFALEDAKNAFLQVDTGDVE